jgi:hypothetical protein
VIVSRFYKAQSVNVRVPVPDLALLFNETLPDASTHATQLDQASRLAGALWDTLPGGVVDALLVEMMRRRSSALKVGHREVDDEVGMPQGPLGVRAQQLDSWDARLKVLRALDVATERVAALEAKMLNVESFG